MMSFTTLLASFKPEHEFAREVPSDLVVFMKALSDLGLKTEIPADWNDGHPMSRFVERWENVQPEGRPTQNRYPKEMFDQVGLALKVIFAWDTLSLALFGKGRVANEIILETANDLKCSAFLSSELFAKQSLQMLRNFCEACMGILYFQKAEEEFADWVDDSVNYHYPAYRNMVNKLKISQILSPKESGFLHRKYSQLNNSVHNKRNRLNMSLKRIEEQIDTHGASDIAEWAREIKRTVGFMLELFIRLWQANYWHHQ